MIASAKGGAGVSMLTAGIAADLARRGLDVVVADLDPRRGGDLGVYLGAGAGRPGAPAGAAGVHYVASPQRGGLRRLAGAHPGDAPAAVLVDPGTLPPGRAARALAAADRAMVVITPEPAAVEGACRVLAELAGLRAARWLSRRQGPPSGGDGRTRPASLRGSGDWPPAPSRIAAALEVPAEDLLRDLSARPVDLVINQVRRAEDVEVAVQLVRAARERFGLALRLKGAIGHDDRLWIAVRKRLPSWGGGWGRTWSEDVGDLVDRMLTGRDVDAPAGSGTRVAGEGSALRAEARGGAPDALGAPGGQEVP